MKVLYICLLAIVAMCGCGPAAPSSSVSQNSTPAWVSGITLDRAKTLSPEESKAIMIAFAFVLGHEKSGSMPVVQWFNVADAGSRWVISMSYSSYEDRNKVKAAGDFCNVLVAKDWQTVELGPGGA